MKLKRKGLWWIYPLVVFWLYRHLSFIRRGRRFRASIIHFGNYLSPFYSPEIFGASPHAMFGVKPAWIPDWLPFSPALLILWAPAGFRFTCYYYRGAYYKAFWADPPSCAVGEPRTDYRGERKFPLILQNVHRYFLYLALDFFNFSGLRRLERVSGLRTVFTSDLGSIILTANVFFLGGYTFSVILCAI